MSALPTAIELFEKAGFVRRKKGQRYAKRVLDTFTFESRMPKNVIAHYVIGQFTGSDGFGFPMVFDAICITLADGFVRVPAYRRHDKVRDFAIVQSSEFLLQAY